MITEKQAASAQAGAENLVNGMEWDDASIGAAVKVIDIIQAIILPFVKRLNPKLGAYAEIAIQTVEDALRKMLPQTTT